jgi:hypothetical protein
VTKGTVNVAETGKATYKSRTVLSACKGVKASKTGYHRYHGEQRMDDCLSNVKLMLDPSVWNPNPHLRDILLEPGWSDADRLGASKTDVLPASPETQSSLRSQGQNQPPKVSRVSSFEHGNLDLSAQGAILGKPPGPAMSQARGGASVVVRARESRVHGKGRQ